MGQGEYFGRVREGNGALSWRIECVEEVDKERNQAKVCTAALRNPETEASRQKRPAHVREREEKKCSATKSVNRPDGRPSEDEIYQTKAPGS